jgi:predicted nucleic-acid-binding protein
MKIADTNVVLSLILPNRPVHSALAEAAVRDDGDPVVVSETVLAECVWVLCCNYAFSRQDAARQLLEAIEGPGLQAANRAIAANALHLMIADPSLGIVDCLLLAQGLEHDAEVLTFDRRLQRRAQEYVRP